MIIKQEMAFKVSAGESYSSAFQSSRGVESTFFLCKKGNLGRTRRNSGDKTFFCEASAFSWFSSFSLSKKLEEKCRKKKNEICREELPFLQFFDRFGCRTTIFFFFDFLHLSPSSHRTEKSRKRIRQLEQKLKGCHF